MLFEAYDSHRQKCWVNTNTTRCLWLCAAAVHSLIILVFSGQSCLGPQLARNKRLDSFFVRDLNAEPDGWALADQSLDAVLCCVSVQYLQQARIKSPVLHMQHPQRPW